VGELLLAAIVPHPPIMVAEVGRGEEAKVQATRDSMQALAGKLQEMQPDTLVVITPHGTLFSDVITLPAESTLAGDLSRFRAPQVRLEYERDRELGELVLRCAAERGIPVHPLDGNLAKRLGISLALDHGIVAPFSFFRDLAPKPRLLPINMGLFARERLYEFGIALQEAIRQSSRRVAVVASSDLSHRVTPEAPAGYDPRGREFDLELKRLLEAFDVPGILAIPEELQEAAGECGYRSIVMALGALDGYEVEHRVLSYEAPFGVGYLVAQFIPVRPSAERRLLERLLEKRRARLAARKQAESPVVRLARQSLEHYYATGEMLRETDLELPPGLPPRAGVFVSLKKDGQLRGCIGTTGPTMPTLKEEIIANALKAALEDPRFDPVEKEELDELTISVDVLGRPEPVAGIEDLDPQQYGVIVTSGSRRGLLLPALEGVDTAEQQVDIARRKAGIGPQEPVKLERFTVTRFT